MTRYRFVDQVVSLELGASPRIEVAKTFAAQDDFFTGPTGPGRVPDSLLLELAAMTGGHLVFRYLGGSRLPLLLKVPKWEIEGQARPGERLIAQARLRGVSGVGDGADVAEAAVEVHGPEGPVAGGRIVYVCVAVPGLETLAGEVTV
ncbi:MAG: hypothetical protein A2X36_02490 [Elusimicrobia bacterium GWA2_69_24]|nr:MAG: hypothetical protein A2W08_03655 [Candidatus Rokubacteria bacterium RBG_16_73_20]OGR60911.1 MAG: hypothetical protein A2X36_02490 [Elusimicrobia bacterium GWA2_69_24]HBH00743.1 hypothetical protein [Candidatus Rokubacteria bacterium]